MAVIDRTSTNNSKSKYNSPNLFILSSHTDDETVKTKLLSEYDAFLLPRLLRFLSFEPSPDRFVEHFSKSILRKRRAFYVLDCADFAAEFLAFGRLDDFVSVGAGGGVSKVDFGADEDDRCAGAVVRHLRQPLLLNVRVRCAVGDGKAEEENVGLWIG